jgi:hypothetical protein
MVSACGSDHHPVPPDGIVTGIDHNDQWVQMMFCGKGCLMPLSHPEDWHLEITATHNHGWKGSVEVDHEVYDRCPLRSVWPDCAHTDDYRNRLSKDRSV